MEDQDSPTLSSIYFSNAKSIPPCFTQTFKTLESEKGRELKKDLSFDDIQFEAKCGQKCFIVFSITNRDELSGVLSTLAIIKKELKDRQIIAITLLKNHSDKIEEALLKSGCSEVLRFDVSGKALAYKIKRFLKMLDQESEKLDENLIDLGKTTSGDSSSATNVRAFVPHKNKDPLPQFRIKNTEAIKDVADFWLFRKNNYAKKYQNKWLVEIIGPSPSAGSWEPSTPGNWKWCSNEKFKGFDPSPRSWFFHGNKPEYSWVTNRWGFVSEFPSLHLMEHGTISQTRFKLVDANTIEITKNSDAAVKLFAAIKETYDIEYVILSEDTTIPWADRTNSKDLKPSDWIKHDLSEKEASDWNRSEEIVFLTGKTALAPSGAKGFLKGASVDLLEYEDEKMSFALGVSSNLVGLNEAVDLVIKIENLGFSGHVNFAGTVTQKEAIDDLGNHVVRIQCAPNSATEFKNVKAAIEKRQFEVVSFFSQALG